MRMIDYIFWTGVMLWSAVIAMWPYDSKVSWPGLLALSAFILLVSMIVMLFLMSFLYGIVSAIELAV